jgi:hypothetical protein
MNINRGIKAIAGAIGVVVALALIGTGLYAMGLELMGGF